MLCERQLVCSSVFELCAHMYTHVPVYIQEGHLSRTDAIVAPTTPRQRCNVGWGCHHLSPCTSWWRRGPQCRLTGCLKGRDRFLKKSPWERRVRVPKAQGMRCGVWGGGSAPHQKRILILDLKWANFGANSAFCTVHLKLVSLV